MKKKCVLVSLMVLFAAMVGAQTMNVVVGDVVYQFPAAQAGDMNYDDGTTLTILNKVFTVSDITKIYVDETEVKDNTVSVSYDGMSATVSVAGNVAQYVTPTVSGAHVSIEQSSEVGADNVGEITYSLSGTSVDGEFYLSGSYKTTVELNGLKLTNASPVWSGAAVNIQNGKRIDISVKKNTENTLTDCASGSQKACLVVKGHAELKGKGVLNIYGKLNHGIKTGEYMTLKNCTLNVLAAQGDGIHVNEYFLMESGSVTISGVGDDGIQAEVDGTTSTGETTDHEDEDSGNIYLEGGTVTATVTATAAKGIKAEGDLKVSGDVVVDVTTSGNGTYDSTERDAKGSAGLKSGGHMTISGGTLTLKSTGTGGKCIKADGELAFSGHAIVTATSTGSNYKYSNQYSASAKAIKSDGAMTISSGTITAYAKSHEAIETKSTLDITGGTVSATSSDDAINSSSHMTISGGYVMGYSTGNDGLDANGNMYIKGGVVYAIGSTQPEMAIDANTEGGYKLYVTGGTIVTVGPLESGSSLTQSCYQGTWSKNTWYALYNDNELVLAVKTPSSGGTGMVVSTAGTPSLMSGVTVSGGTECFTSDGTVMGYTGGSVSGGSTVSLSSYTSSGGGGFGPGGGGGFGPGGGGGPGGRH